MASTFYSSIMALSIHNEFHFSLTWSQSPSRFLQQLLRRLRSAPKNIDTGFFCCNFHFFFGRHTVQWLQTGTICIHFKNIFYIQPQIQLELVGWVAFMVLPVLEFHSSVLHFLLPNVSIYNCKHKKKEIKFNKIISMLLNSVRKNSEFLTKFAPRKKRR